MIKFTDFIDPIAFFVSFAIAFFFYYILAPKKKIVIQYPTPENAEKIVYQTETDTCYKYKAQEVTCPKNKSVIQDIMNLNTPTKE